MCFLFGGRYNVYSFKEVFKSIKIVCVVSWNMKNGFFI